MGKKLNSVLLIDDNPATNLIHKKVITKIDCVEHIHICNGGEKALEFLTTEKDSDTLNTHPQLVFLDINMPGMNGWEFVEEYDELLEGQKCQVLIMMLTTSINPDDRHKADQTKSIAGFLNKPLTTDVVEQVIKEHFAAPLIVT